MNAPLPDPGRLAAQVAEVVQLGPADAAVRDNLDLVDRRAVHREGPLDADAVADLANGEGLAHAATGAADDDTLEDLDPRPVAFLDAHVHLQRVTRAESRDVRADLSQLEVGDRGVHDSSSSLIVVRARGNACDVAFGAGPVTQHAPQRDRTAGGRVSVCHIPGINRKARPRNRLTSLSNTKVRLCCRAV